MFEVFRQRQHFKRRIRSVDVSIWDLSFQREKLKMLREDVRGQYDRINEASEMAKRKLEEEKAAEKPNEQNLKGLQTVIDKYAPDLEYKKKQIEGLDMQIDGPLTDEQGLDQSCQARIEGFRALKAMYREYLKQL